MSGVIWVLMGDAYAQSGLYKAVLADCVAVGRDRDRCVTYSSCVESQARRDLTAVDQARYRLEPKNPEFLKWAAKAKRYCIDKAGLPPENPPAKVTANDPANTLLILTTAGLIKIALLPTEAPKHVESLKDFVRGKYYDGRDLTFQNVNTAGVSIRYDASRPLPELEKQSAGTALDRGDVALLDDGAVFIARGYNQNSIFTVVGRVADGLNVLDSLKAPDTSGPVFGYPPNRYFEPDQVLAVRIEADAASSDIATLENDKTARLAARDKKNAEHARKYESDLARLTQIVNGVSGSWTSVLKSDGTRDLTTTWVIKREADNSAPSRRTLYSGVSVLVTIPSEPGQSVTYFQLQGGIERENLTASGVHVLYLESGPAVCRINWKLQAKSPTEFDGVWTVDRTRSRAGCQSALPRELTGTVHLQKG